MDLAMEEASERCVRRGSKSCSLHGLISCNWKGVWSCLYENMWDCACQYDSGALVSSFIVEAGSLIS